MSIVQIAVDEPRRAPAETRTVAGKRESRVSAGLRHFVRWFAAIGLAVNAAGCLLTQDIPDPALDIPNRYKSGRRRGHGCAADARLVAGLRLP
ncbi:hypothetical protein ACVIJ6_005929 [Bradyrhizobium sp. USDA 4369]